MSYYDIQELSTIIYSRDCVTVKILGMQNIANKMHGLSSLFPDDAIWCL